MSDSIRSIKLQSSDKCSLLNCFDLFHTFSSSSDHHSHILHNFCTANDSGDRCKQTCTFKIKCKNGGVNEKSTQCSLDWTLHTPSCCHIYLPSDVGFGFFLCNLLTIDKKCRILSGSFLFTWSTHLQVLPYHSNFNRNVSVVTMTDCQSCVVESHLGSWTLWLLIVKMTM